MDTEGLVHVNDDKVVISVFGAGVLGLVQLGGCIQQTEHGVDPLAPLLGRDVTPTQGPVVLVKMSVG